MKAVFLVLTLAWASLTVEAGEPPDSPTAVGPQTPATQETINKLLAVIAAHEARIQALENELEKKLGDSGSSVLVVPAHLASAPQNVAPPPPPEIPVQQAVDNPAQTQDTAMGGHNIAIPNGYLLKITCFFRF